MRKYLQVICLSALVLTNCTSQPVKLKEVLYIGTYSLRNSQGIYVYEFNRESATFTLKQTFADLRDPGFLELHPSGKYLYSVSNKTDDKGNRVDFVTAFAIDKTDGTLDLINQVPAYGKGACHVHTDKSGAFVYISFYSSGNLSVFRVNTDGSIGDSVQTIKYEGSSINLPRQETSHVHSSQVSPDNQYLYVADLGTDRIMIHSTGQSSGLLSPATSVYAATIPGSGPRHLVFHPGRPFLYLAEELSSTVSLFYQDPSTGSLTLIQRLSTLPVDFTGQNTVADIHTDSEGRFLYVSNRGHNSLAVYSVAEKTGELDLIDFPSVEGEHPRNFLIDPDGKFVLVANRDTDDVILFERDRESGMITDTGMKIEVPAPVCLKWLKIY